MIRMWLNDRMDTDDKRMCTGVKVTNLLHYKKHQGSVVEFVIKLIIWLALITFLIPKFNNGPLLTTTYYSIQPVIKQCNWP